MSRVIVVGRIRGGNGGGQVISLEREEEKSKDLSQSSPPATAANGRPRINQSRHSGVQSKL